MKKYENPKIEKVTITAADIIATSGEPELLEIPGADVTGARGNWKWNKDRYNY